MTKLHLNKNYQELLITLKNFGISLSDNQLQKLSSDLEEILNFQQKLPSLKIKNLFIPKNRNELIEIFALRSKVYKKEGYDKEFPNFISGLNYDKYDKSSAILFVKFGNKITGSCRIVFDTPQKLPLDKNYSLDYLRSENRKLCELSRLAVDKNGLGQEPKLLTKGTYCLLKKVKFPTLVSITDKKAYNRYYKNFGGFKIEYEFNGYGKLNKTFIVSSWDIAKVSLFFRRAFLKN